MDNILTIDNVIMTDNPNKDDHILGIQINEDHVKFVAYQNNDALCQLCQVGPDIQPTDLVVMLTDLIVKGLNKVQGVLSYETQNITVELYTDLIAAPDGDGKTMLVLIRLDGVEYLFFSLHGDENTHEETWYNGTIKSIWKYISNLTEHIANFGDIQVQQIAPTNVD